MISLKFDTIASFYTAFAVYHLLCWLIILLIKLVVNRLVHQQQMLAGIEPEDPPICRFVQHLLLRIVKTIQFPGLVMLWLQLTVADGLVGGVPVDSVTIVFHQRNDQRILGLAVRAFCGIHIRTGYKSLNRIGFAVAGG